MAPTCLPPVLSAGLSTELTEAISPPWAAPGAQLSGSRQARRLHAALRSPPLLFSFLSSALSPAATAHC